MKRSMLVMDPNSFLCTLVKQLQFRIKEAGRSAQVVQGLNVFSLGKEKHGGVGKGHHGHTDVGVCLPTLPGPLCLP